MLKDHSMTRVVVFHAFTSELTCLESLLISVLSSRWITLLHSVVNNITQGLTLFCRGTHCGWICPLAVKLEPVQFLWVTVNFPLVIAMLALAQFFQNLTYVVFKITDSHFSNHLQVIWTLLKEHLNNLSLNETWI